MLAPYDAVLFDLDDTLIADEAMNRHAFFVTALEVTGQRDAALAMAARAEHHAKALWNELPKAAFDYAHRIGHSAIEGLWATYDSGHAEERLIEAQMERTRPEVWRRALADVGASADPTRMAKRWRDVRQQFPLYADTDTVLASLTGRVKLGVVTNGVRGLQRRKLEGSGLLHWFDAVAVSGEVGLGKPERGIFEWVASQLEVSLERCVMVGDNPGRDVLGGANAGMQTVWVDRGFRAPPTQPATLSVKQLSDAFQG